jgi:hypothetical protein
MLLKNTTRNIEITSIENSFSLTERALKRKKNNVDNPKYIDLRFLRPTSNLCERFFSIAGFCLSSRRESILSSNFEIQMFLNINGDLWGVDDVKRIC